MARKVGAAVAYRGPAPQASGPWASTAKNHTSCFSEGTDAQVLFKEMCHRRRLLACHSVPREYTQQRMDEVHKIHLHLTELKAVQTM